MLDFRLMSAFAILFLLIANSCTKESAGPVEPEEPQYHWREIILDHNRAWNLGAIAASDSTAAILGDSVLLFSRNGLDWYTRTPLGHAQQIVWNGSQFYAFSTYEDLVTSNLHAWDTLAKFSHPGFLFVDWFDTMFVASDDGMQIQTCMYSKDGIDWDAQYSTVGHPFLGITKRDSIFVAVGGRIMVSYDAAMWTEIETDVEFYYLDGITYNADRYVAVGTYGTIMTSTNAVDWVRTESPTGKPLGAVAWNGEVFVAVGGDYGANAVVVMSYDGISWDKVYEHQGGRLHDIIWYRDHFIAVGDGGLIVVSYME